MALVEASAPTLHLGTACYYGGWASLKNARKKNASFSLFAHSFSLSTVMRTHRHTHMSCTYMDTHTAFLGMHRNCSGLPNNKRATRFPTNSSKIIPTTGSSPNKGILQSYIINMQAMSGVGNGTPPARGRTQKRSRVENYHPTRVAEAIQLLKAGSHSKSVRYASYVF